MMKTNIFILFWLCFGLNAGAQQYLSRETYRDKVEAYSQILKQQQLKSVASIEARKIAATVRKENIVLTLIKHWLH